MHPKHKLHDPSRLGGCDRLFLPGSPVHAWTMHNYCPECWYRDPEKVPPMSRTGEAIVPWRCGQVWVPVNELWEAMTLWAAGQAYWKNNFRLGGKNKRGPIAPWNLEVKTYLSGVEVGDAESTKGMPLDAPPSILTLACERAGFLNREQAPVTGG